MHRHSRPIHPGRTEPGPYGPYRLALCPDTMHRHLAAAHRARAQVIAVLLQAALDTVRRGLRAAAEKAAPPCPAWRPTHR